MLRKDANCRKRTGPIRSREIDQAEQRKPTGGDDRPCRQREPWAEAVGRWFFEDEMIQRIQYPPRRLRSKRRAPAVDCGRSSEEHFQSRSLATPTRPSATDTGSHASEPIYTQGGRAAGLGHRNERRELEQRRRQRRDDRLLPNARIHAGELQGWIGNDMRMARIGFHLVMLVLLVMAFAGAFSPPKSGNLAADNGGFIMPAIGIVTAWIVGVVILRIMGRSTKG
jgi:hypothetical protein